MRQSEEPQIKGQIGDVEKLPAEHQAGREEQADRASLAIDAVEVSELGDHFSRGIHNHDFVCLVATDPKVVVTVNDQAVGTADAVNEDARSTVIMGPPVKGNLNDRRVPGVRDEEFGLRIIEVQTVGSKRRKARRPEQWIVDPASHAAARPVGTPKAQRRKPWRRRCADPP